MIFKYLFIWIWKFNFFLRKFLEIKVLSNYLFFVLIYIFKRFKNIFEVKEWFRKFKYELVIRGF